MRGRKATLRLLIAGALVGGFASSAFANIVNLTTAGASGTINGAIYQQISPQSTGTGVIDSFDRNGANGAEASYNTSGTLSSPLNQQGGSTFNHDLALSAVPIVTIGGVQYRQFLLDINQNGANPLVNLNQVQIFQTSQGGQTGGTVDLATGRISGLTGTLVYDMNAGGGTANTVLMDYSLNSGSGSGDMFLYVPNSVFNAANGDKVILYNQFGTPPGANASNDGFEEWAVLTGAVVPEPTTILAGALLLLPFGLSSLRVLRRKSAA